MEDDLFPIGRVIKAHGIKGKIKVRYYGEDPGRGCYYRRVMLRDGTGIPRTFDILQAAFQPPSNLLLELKGIEKIEEVEPLIGREVLVRREDLPDLEEDEYYYQDLLGMGVETEKGKKIGTVKEIFPTRANDVYVVQGKRGEIFLPAIGEVIKNIDRRRGVMKVHWIEGLWEAEDEI
jgi:16S rRNA processing protein RimM